MASSSSGNCNEDLNFYLPFAEYLDPVQYEYHEVDSSEIPSSELLHEMQNMPPPNVPIQEESFVAADDAITPNAVPKKKSRFFKHTKTSIDKVQEASIKDRTLKQTIWGVNVFRGN